MTTLEDLKKKVKQGRKEVPLGSLWRHLKTNTLYTVRDIVVVESDLSLAVSYTQLKDKSRIHWIRPLDEFLDGRFKRELLVKDEVVHGDNNSR